MKSIYQPSDIFVDCVVIKKEILGLLKKYGYHSYIIAIAKDDPDDEEQILVDTYYSVENSGLIEFAKRQLEQVEDSLEEDETTP